MSFSPPRPPRSPLRPLDRVAAILMVLLAIAAILLVFLGDHATARVQDFSWDEHTIGGEDIAFSLIFNRPMNIDSVEANLEITPDLPGRISWAGRRLAYTLDGPVPYGGTFEVKLTAAHDRFADLEKSPQFEPFTGIFQSRDRAMAYIGTEGDEAGRLVLINFTQGGDPLLLTPPNLTVLDFEPYPLGDRLLFAAVETTEMTTGNLEPTLYAVATGLTPNPPEIQPGIATSPASAPAPAGTLTPILSRDGYQNLAFDLSSDGRLIVVQRINLADPADLSLWLLPDDEDPRPLETEPGGEFLIAPDNQTLLMLQGQGTAVIPLSIADRDEVVSGEPLDFLPEFGRVFGVSSDGRAATMVNFNQDDPERRFTESLVLVTNQGEDTELLNVTGSILDAQFDPTNRIVYALASELLPGEAYQEQPFLAAINIEAQQPLPLLTLPPQSHPSLSIAPDGLAALMELSVPSPDDPMAETMQMVLLPLFSTTEERLNGMPSQTTPQVLPYAGRSPQWLP